MAGGTRCGLKARDHTGPIIFLVMFENMLLHHSGGTTALSTKTTLEQDPQMLQVNVIVCPSLDDLISPQRGQECWLLLPGSLVGRGTQMSVGRPKVNQSGNDPHDMYHCCVWFHQHQYHHTVGSRRQYRKLGLHRIVGFLLEQELEQSRREGIQMKGIMRDTVAKETAH